MKHLKLFIFLLLLSPSVATAANIACKGTITWVMGDHPSCKDENGKKQLAFKHTTGAYWFCSGSDSASALILSAKMSKAPINIYMNDANGGTCNVHQHYLKPTYVIVP